MPDVFDALAHPVRREVLRRLRGGPMTAGALADLFDVSKPTMSRHFATLKEAGLILAERQGTSVRYRLNASVADEAIGLVMGLFKIAKPTPGVDPDPKSDKETDP